MENTGGWGRERGEGREREGWGRKGRKQSLKTV